MKNHILLLILICSINLFSQNRSANIWYFGMGCGLDFNSGTPVALTNGALNTGEGCASICDNSGGILFYSDGCSVYNRLHETMPNGTGLLGDFSASQSCIVVPQPNISNLYYLFTVGENGENGLRYSKIDMSLEMGYGDVVGSSKNIQLFDEDGLNYSLTEKITSVRHDDGKSVWVITHEALTNKFLVYLIDGISGEITGPDAYLVGSNHVSDWGTTHGYLKSSPDGSKLAIAIHSNSTEGIIEILDFNTLTGAVSNPITISNVWRPYGLEFSPNSKLVYGTSCSFTSHTSSLYQINLEDPDPIATYDTLYNGTTLNLLAIQLGPDGKIYVTHDEETSIGKINFPDSVGTAAFFEPLSVDLDGRTCRFGLPNLFYYKGFQNEISQLHVDDNILVFPSLVGPKGEIFVKFNSTKAGVFKIYDSVGKLIHAKEFEDNSGKISIVLSDINYELSKGVYFLTIITEDNIFFNGKFIVE